jgi:hypothetical protein
MTAGVSIRSVRAIQKVDVADIRGAGRRKIPLIWVCSTGTSAAPRRPAPFHPRSTRSAQPEPRERVRSQLRVLLKAFNVRLGRRRFNFATVDLADSETTAARHGRVLRFQ